MKKIGKVSMKEIKDYVRADTYSVRDGVYTVRKSFFYKYGKSQADMVKQIKGVFNNVIIIDSGEVNRPFRGGASIRSQSHWWVKFSFDVTKPKFHS